MPKYVQAYGQTIEFPDDMADSDIAAAIKKNALSIPKKAPPIIGGVDPTSDMSTADKFMAGIGKGMTDVARGVGQAMPNINPLMSIASLFSDKPKNSVSRADITESRRLDQPLMNTGAGTAGSITGSVATMLPAAFIPGANTMAGAAGIGAITGALAPSESNSETAKNVAIGGVLGPAAIGVGRLVGSAVSGVKALAEPFTKGGQDAMAARVLQQFAADPKAARQAMLSAREFVPGSAPTMAQASGDAGLAQLERTLVNNPESGNLLAQQYSAQRAARASALNKIAGEDSYYAAIKDGRRVFANEDYAAAMAGGIDPKMAKAMAPQIANLMERPSIQQARAEAISLAKENGQSISNFGSIEGLGWLKKGLDNLISKASSPGNSIGKDRLRAMLQTKNDLMTVIEEVAPAYKVANDNFAGMSRQIYAMDAARAIKDKFEPALNGYGATTREHAEAYARALDAAKESIKKSAGVNKPLESVMPTRDLATLEGIAMDLGRKAKADDLGRAVGSNTAQNLAAQNLLRRVLGPSGLPQSWAESQGLQNLLLPYTKAAQWTGAERRLMERIARAAANPSDAASLLGAPQAIRKGGGLLSPDIESLIPAITSGGLLAYRGQ